MTNREYVNTLNNEELANAIRYLPKICDEMGPCDPGTNCVQCCYKWLGKERAQTEIHEGEVRANISHGYYMVVKAQERNYRVMYLDGSFEWLSNSDIATDEPTDMTMKKFLEIVMETINHVRKKGKWIVLRDEYGDICEAICSCCEDNGNHRWKYCPNCGAEMRVEE